MAEQETAARPRTGRAVQAPEGRGHPASRRCRRSRQLGYAKLAEETATSSRRSSRSSRCARCCRCSRAASRRTRSATSARSCRISSSPMPRLPQAELGVFGGSGFTRSSRTSTRSRSRRRTASRRRRSSSASVGGTRVAFLPRHGREARAAAAPHPVPGERVGDARARRPAHDRPERLRALERRPRAGRVRRLRPVRRPHHAAGLDTFYDGPETTHVSAADPYCPDLRRLLVETGARARHHGARRRHGRRRSRAPGSRRAPSRGGSRTRAGT